MVFASVVQLDRMSDFGSDGCRFESCRMRSFALLLKLKFLVQNQDLEALIALLQVPNIGHRTCKALIKRFGSSRTVFELTPQSLLKIKGIGNTIVQAWSSKNKYLSQAQAIIEHAAKNQIEILTFQDGNFPQRLLEKDITDAPLLLYVKGKTNLNLSKMLSIVGTRQCTSYGRKQTYTIVQNCQHYSDLAIISGLAYGIDIQAHRACLEYNIPTIAILGSGLSNIYPAEHRYFVDKIIGQGGTLISEYPYYKRPDRAHFPSRNRIIAGMSDAVIVVESALRGGSLLTAKVAHSYHKTVFAVPGNLTSKYSEGTNDFISRNMAIIYLNTNSLDYHLNWDLMVSQPEPKTTLQVEKFTPDQQLILKLLETHESCAMNEIVEYTELEVESITGLLFNLEMDGVIVHEGGMYRLKHL